MNQPFPVSRFLMKMLYQASRLYFSLPWWGMFLVLLIGIVAARH